MSRALFAAWIMMAASELAATGRKVQRGGGVLQVAPELFYV
jgi:hypothetical protein